MEDFDKIEQDLSAGWVRTVKDLFAGASGGITQVLLGKFLSRIQLLGLFTLHFILSFELLFFQVTCIMYHVYVVAISCSPTEVGPNPKR
jgi:hypothetical protein